MEVSKSNLFVTFTAVGLIGAIAYVITMGERIDSDGKVQFASEMAVWELVLLSYGLLAVFLKIFVAAFDAHAQGYKKLVLVSIFLWPLSIACIWLSATGYFRRQRKVGGDDGAQ